MTINAPTFNGTFFDGNGITQKQTDYANDLKSDCINLIPTMKTKIDYATNSEDPQTKDEKSLQIQKLKVLKQKMEDPSAEQVSALNSFGSKRTYATKESATVDLKVLTHDAMMNTKTMFPISYILENFGETLHSHVAKMIFETKKDGDKEIFTKDRRKDSNGKILENIMVSNTDLTILIQNCK